MNGIEILAPAGSPESLKAAVRCGADAVYFGGKSFNARNSATNFDGGEMAEAVKYCHGRGVKAYLTLNTLVTDAELEGLGEAVKSACEAGIDAVIAQDLAVASLVRAAAPTLPLFASTQMSVHNAEGAKELETLGFSRVILARELSEREIGKIAETVHIPLECFVHGALCMSVSGQCYLSAMLGGRSGNRGRCAQPCRLPMGVNGRENALSLKDLSLMEQIPAMVRAGVSSLKIEGRMKRPEYVAASVTACRLAAAGKAFDKAGLEAVFSRSGFTGAYFEGKLGIHMFGARTKENVTAASAGLLRGIAASCKEEQPLVPVAFSLSLRRGEPARLVAKDAEGNTAEVSGAHAEEARTAPLTEEKARALLSKTGGTPFYMDSLTLTGENGLILPASGVNALRRGALLALLKRREETRPHPFTDPGALLEGSPHAAPADAPALRIRFAAALQLTEPVADAAGMILLPVSEIGKLKEDAVERYKDKIAAELPRVFFEGYEKLDGALHTIRQRGISKALVGNPGAINAARKHGFTLHGDYALNITNSLALKAYETMGLKSVTASFELTARQLLSLRGEIPRGILAYGYLPLMIMRACPKGDCGACKNPEITDRLGNRFPLLCTDKIPELLNCVPLFLADRLRDFTGLDFITLYFTKESPEECARILRLYQTGGKLPGPMTRGLYYRGVT